MLVAEGVELSRDATPESGVEGSSSCVCARLSKRMNPFHAFAILCSQDIVHISPSGH